LLFSFFLGAEKCSNYGECDSGGVSTATIIVIVVTAVFTLLLPICTIYIRYRRARNANNSRIIHLPTNDQGVQIPRYLLTNSGATQENSLRQVYNIPISSTIDLNIEEPPPSYDATMLSLTTQNQNKV